MAASAAVAAAAVARSCPIRRPNWWAPNSEEDASWWPRITKEMENGEEWWASPEGAEADWWASNVQTNMASLYPGQRVVHPARGHGQVLKVDMTQNHRYSVEFANGEVHIRRHCIAMHSYCTAYVYPTFRCMCTMSRQRDRSC